MEHATLSPENLCEVLDRVTKRGETAATRICNILADHPQTSSGTLYEATGIANLSDIVEQRINPNIIEMGLIVG